MIAAR
jgi:hypothetical protein